MKALKTLLVALFGHILNFYITVHCDYGCNLISQDTGTISVLQDVLQNSWFHRCWEFSVGEDYVLHLKITQFNIVSYDSCTEESTRNYYRTSTFDYYRKSTTFDYYRKSTTDKPIVYDVLTIHDEYNATSYIVRPLHFNRNTLTIRGNANISLEIDNRYRWCLSRKITLKLEFSKVNGIETVDGVSETRDKIATMLKNQLLPPLKWNVDIEKTVIALHLSGSINFSKTGLIEELLVKQLDLKSTVALLRNKSNTVSVIKLSKIINSLLVTCHNPRKFYGYNLLKMVKEKLEDPSVIPNPLAYIALCNAKEKFTFSAVEKLRNITKSQSTPRYPFSSDIDALAFMALSCIRNQDDEVRYYTEREYNESFAYLKMQQQGDGSFGNIYSTVIITQALMSSNFADQFLMKNYVVPAVKFLIKHLNASDFRLMDAYYNLPILKGKTLLDIRHTDCSRNPRKDRDGSDISDLDETEKKIKVQYSLIFGDKEDVTNTLTLQVSENTTADKIMLIAQAIEPKYKFEWKRISGKMYVYEMAGIPVDPEEGRFWLTYFKNSTSTELNPVIAGPDKLQLHDGYHLIQWYKSVHS